MKLFLIFWPLWRSIHGTFVILARSICHIEKPQLPTTSSLFAPSMRIRLIWIRSNSSGIHELQSAQAMDFEGCFQHPPAGSVKHPSRVAENGTRLKVCEKNILRADSMLFRIFQVCLDHDILPQQHKSARKHQYFFRALWPYEVLYLLKGEGLFWAFSKTDTFAFNGPASVGRSKHCFKTPQIGS